MSIKVAVNYGNYKNRLGAYHAPIHTFLDFTFLRSLPIAQVRNGFAELIKISSCSHLEVFNLLDKYCEQLIEHKFGRGDGSSEELTKAADIVWRNPFCHPQIENPILIPCQINREGIHEMLKLETPNLHEIGLDRVIAYGHTWSPLHELVPETPLRHGHAISIDMAYSATLANHRGLLSDEEHARLLTLFSRAGLSIDHPQFDEDVLERGTAAILKTRDGKLRLAVPNPLGSCTFLNDVSGDEMALALRKHKEFMKSYPRQGEGLEAYVDASDTGYTDLAQENKGVLETVEENGDGLKKKNAAAAAANGALDEVNFLPSGLLNGQTNGHAKAETDGVKKISDIRVAAVGTVNGVH